MCFNSSIKYSIMLLLLFGCKKLYQPAAIQAKNNYLVVDGIINIGANSITRINLNRSLNLNDSVTSTLPELNATFNIVSSNGDKFPLVDSASSGIYISAALNLDINLKYGVQITTSDGHTYSSDLVECKPTPLIDSLYWEQPNDFTVYVDTHDPNNNTHYYRWDYIETWEHDAQYATPWGVSNNMIFAVDSITQKTQCWNTNHSSDILLASSANLGQDIISKFPVITIINPDSRLNMKYSLLLEQYALTADAYKYWQTIQKTSQQLGTLFDLQPAQLIGNIHSTSNPNEPVIGYMSASTIERERIFLYQTNLTNWRHNTPIYSCDTLEIPVDPTDYRIYNDAYPGYAPYYFISGGPLVLASSICLDCTFFGGTTIKPPYWK